MAVTAKQRMTVGEYLDLTRDDERPTELVDGELVVNHPRYPHGRLQAILISALRDWERAVPGRGEVCGPTEVRLTDHDLYGPDLVVAPPMPRLTERETLAVLPLLCIEIRSPSTWRYDIGRKKSVFEQRGVPELWLVDGTAAAVLVFRRSSPDAASFDTALELTAGDTLASPLLPGFGLAVASLFERR